MKFFARLEAACALAVERTFAVAFPSALQPVQIARKLVAAFEAGPPASGRGGRRFIIRMSPADFARFGTDGPYLERQWSAMLVRLTEGSGRPQRPPEVRVQEDRATPSGTVAITVEMLPEPVTLTLRVRKGLPANARVPLDARVIVGRDPDCDLALYDPRVSRRHAEIIPVAGMPWCRDLRSANGTWLNGRSVESSELGMGDVLTLGDSELMVEGDEA